MQIMDITKDLKSNSYPGRGIVLGRSADGKSAVIAYFIMGRSENSRNRIFSVTEDGIRTEAFDPAKMTDPSLIIYHPVRVVKNLTVVTNGDQTDTIMQTLNDGHCYRHGLHERTFEPDAPNYTPRISGVMRQDGSYNLSILKSLNGDPAFCCRYFYEYEGAPAGYGHFIHTYQGDGNPLPSFEGEPKLVCLPEGDVNAVAEALWESLDGDNRVSLFVRFLNLSSHETQDVIINRHQR